MGRWEGRKEGTGERAGRGDWFSRNLTATWRLLGCRWGERPLAKPSSSPLSPAFLPPGTGLLSSAPARPDLGSHHAGCSTGFLFIYFAEAGGV